MPQNQRSFKHSPQSRFYFLKLTVELFDLALYGIPVLMLFARKHHLGNVFNLCCLLCNFHSLYGNFTEMGSMQSVWIRYDISKITSMYWHNEI